MSQQSTSNICDKTVFAALYKKYIKGLVNFLYYKYGDGFNPQDRAQDAFSKVWENCEKITPEKAKSYLYTTANNLMLNEFKHQKVVLKYQEVKPKDYTNENPEFILRKKQFLESYQKALGELKEEQRIAFLLNKAEGKSHKEIAELLGVSKKVVEYRIYSAFKALKTRLEDFKLK